MPQRRDNKISIGILGNGVHGTVVGTFGVRKVGVGVDV